jgi:hypothetical protein
LATLKYEAPCQAPGTGDRDQDHNKILAPVDQTYMTDFIEHQLTGEASPEGDEPSNVRTRERSVFPSAVTSKSRAMDQLRTSRLFRGRYESKVYKAELFGNSEYFTFMAKRPILPPVAQLIPSQQPNSIQRLLESFTHSTPPRPPSAAMLPGETPPAERGRYFREIDDARLRAIMQDYGPKLSPEKWHEVAAAFGEGVTVRQIQDRWYNFAKPGLDRRPFTIMERRQVAALAIDHPHQWEWIARQMGNGKYRSATMVKHCGTNILPKLKKLGFDLESGADIALVPDAVFAPRFSKGAVLDSMLADFREKKAAQVPAREAASRAAPVPAPAPRPGPVVVILPCGAGSPQQIVSLISKLLRQ